MRKQHGRHANFFVAMGLLFLAIAVTGFSTTWFLPLARGAFGPAHPIIHLHGVLAFGWLLLFVVQAFLVRQRQVHVHRRLGVAGAVLACGVVASGVLVGLHATRRDLALAPGDPFVLGQFVNILIEMALFGGLVAVAVAMRRHGQVHKRLLLLATISALAPAWLRFRHLFPQVPHPFLVFSLVADSLLLVAMLRDRIVLGRVHPTYWWAGGAMVIVHAVELSAMTSPAWLGSARWLLGAG
jgi:hypothetical protein